MKSVLILAFSNLDHDARVSRHIDFLRTSYSVSIASFSPQSKDGVLAIELPRIKPSIATKLRGGFALLLRRFDLAYKLIYNLDANLEKLKTQTPDLIIANDIETLPLAFKVNPGSKILFDAHEYAPLHFEEKLIWRLLFKRFNEHLCLKYLHRVDQMITVGKGLAAEYARNYDVKPLVLTNANYYRETKVRSTDPNHIKLVHHGAANPSRQLERMIKAMDYIDNRFTLDMILITPAIANSKTRRYLSRIRKLADKNPRVKIIPPVKSHEVVDFISQYDVGIFLLPPVNFNYKNTLPNKLFDFVQARLAIAVGPTPEMAEIVEKYQLGVVSQDFTAKSFAVAVNSLTLEQIDASKQNASNAAKELNAQRNKDILVKITTDLLSN